MLTDIIMLLVRSCKIFSKVAICMQEIVTWLCSPLSLSDYVYLQQSLQYVDLTNKYFALAQLQICEMKENIGYSLTLILAHF